VRFRAPLNGAWLLLSDTKTPDWHGVPNLESKLWILSIFVSGRPREINAAGRRAALIQNIPYKHFGRKNNGSLRSKRGAQFVFDFLTTTTF
jgi:hypothetical protein